MKIFPAIDLSGGRVVRLRQGDYGQMNVYDGDPARVARGFFTAGARNLHLVDLDGAKDGAPANFSVIERICGQDGLFIEVGGGIRNEARIRDYLNLGVGRVILGTAAVQEPAFLREMVKKYGARICVSVDARDGKVAVSGWLDTTDRDAFSFCEQLRDVGVKTIVYTDIVRDGLLCGPNLAVYERLQRLSGLDVVASGGIGGEEDLVALRELGVPAAIVGKALYEGKLELSRALRIAEGKDVS